MTVAETITSLELPLRTGRWAVDPVHSAITFSIRQMGFVKVRGRFERFEVTLDVGQTLGETTVEASIDTRSINTNNADRDTHLRSSDFFNTDVFPMMTFASTAISATDDGWKLSGQLTLNGITRPVTLNVEFNGVEERPGQNRRYAGFSATGTLRRTDFGITFGMLPFGADRLALSDEVKIGVDLAFVEPQE